MKSVFISILNFNGKKNTLECIESLKKINTSNFKLTIHIVDNGSAEKLNLKDDSWGNVALKVLSNENNLGFSGGHNATIKCALDENADYVVMLNNDTYVDKNFLKELLTVSEKDIKIGIVCPKIYFAPGFEFHKKRYSKNEQGKVFWYGGGEIDWDNVIRYNRGVDEVDKGQYDKTEQTEIATGCCMMVKREVFQKV